MNSGQAAPAGARNGQLIDRFRAVRQATNALMAPLCIEDMVVQSMPDASPTKWHAAHTTWFFETFILERFEADFAPFHEDFRVLFNSYYNGVGEQFSRPERGLLSRPTVADVRAYRANVDARVQRLLERDADASGAMATLLEVGLHHEQQHQELLLTDIKHAFSKNPLDPKYVDPLPDATSTPLDHRWVAFDGGVVRVGFDRAASPDGFCFDNEEPRHDALLQPFALANRPATNQEFAAFIADGGYQRPEFWHSAGWHLVGVEKWRAPLYWRSVDGGWDALTLGGRQTLDPHAAVAHVSWYEASAYAAWAGARLPSEFEWEHAARDAATPGNFLESGRLHPTRADADADGAADGAALHQLYGDVWEWTASPYTPYPGFQPAPGALGEYNGKFMCNQYVLRGGSCATSETHIRPTYRNFFPPEARWQFSGFRLARDG